MTETIQIKVPKGHYSTDPTEPVFFYGGPFSNFVTEFGGNFGDKRLSIVAEHEWESESRAQLFERVTYGAQYRTVEHFFQAAKARSYFDHEWVRDAWKPAEAKFRGRGVRLRPDWEKVKLDVMMVGLRVKFAPGSLMANMLLGTGNRYIAEDSPKDDVWGIRDPQGGYTGQNLLGKCLMEVRRELRERQQADLERERVIAQGMDALEELNAVTGEFDDATG
jgi:ribA/ribD-fused uncharacterized protein